MEESLISCVCSFAAFVSALADRNAAAKDSIEKMIDNQTAIEKEQVKQTAEIVKLDGEKDHLEDKIHRVKDKAKKRTDDIVETERKIEKLENDWENRKEPESREGLDAKKVRDHPFAEVSMIVLTPTIVPFRLR